MFVSGLGLFGWCVYLWYRFSDPLLFLEVQATWDQGAGPTTWFKIKYFDIFLAGGYRWGLLLTVQAVAVVIGLLLLGRVKRYFGWGYAAYALVVLAIPLIGTGDFLGTGRYVMVAFPVMAAGGTCRRRCAGRGCVGCSWPAVRSASWCRPRCTRWVS